MLKSEEILYGRESLQISATVVQLSRSAYSKKTFINIFAVICGAYSTEGGGLIDSAAFSSKRDKWLCRLNIRARPNARNILTQHTFRFAHPVVLSNIEREVIAEWQDLRDIAALMLQYIEFS